MDKEIQTLRSITLESGNGGPVVVLPALDAEGDEPSRFLLPPLPSSTLNWLGRFAETVWQQHQKCCALLLLVNPERRSWGLTVPPQSSRRDGVSWQLADAVPKGEVDPDKLLVGGTFQTTALSTPDEAADIIPPTDGLHLVQPVNIELGGSWVYLRVAGRLDTPHPEALVTDDWGARIHEVMRYLNLPD